MRQRLLVEVKFIGNQNTIDQCAGVTTRDLQRVVPGRQREFYNQVFGSVTVNLVPVPGISFVYHIKFDPAGIRRGFRVAGGAGDPDPERIGASNDYYVKQDFVSSLRNSEIVAGDTVNRRISSFIAGVIRGPDVLAARCPA